MHGGELKAYLKTQGKSLAYTPSYGKGPEDQTHQGVADASTTVYREVVNDTTNSKINQFAERAASALSTTKDNIVIEDIHGRIVRLGESIQDGTNTGQASPWTETG